MTAAWYAPSTAALRVAVDERPADPKVPFPLAAFPPTVRAMVAETAEATQTDPAMAGTVALTALSVVAGGRFCVVVKEGWREPVNIFTTVIMESGERKSPVLEAIMAPVRDAEASLVKQAGPGVIQAGVEARIAAKAAERAESAAGGAESSTQRQQLTADAVTAAERAAAMTVPALPRFLASDVTPEAMTGLMAAHGGRIGIVTAEGGLFDVLAGSYSGGVAKLDDVLHGYTGEMIRVDRRSRPPEHIAAPALTIGLMVQPTVMHTIGRNPVLRGRGLWARFLYAVPTSYVGWRDTNAAPVSQDTREDWHRLVAGLAVDLHAAEPADLYLDADAAADQRAQLEAIEVRLRPSGDLRPIKDWASKLAGATVRIAGLLHVAEHGQDAARHPINGLTFRAAIALAGYYVTGAQVALAMLTAPDPALVTPDTSSQVLAIATRQPGGIRAEDVVDELGIDKANARQTFSRLVEAGQLRRVRRGLYAPNVPVT